MTKIIYKIGIVLAGLLLLQNCAGPSTSTSYLKTGKSLYENGKYEQAINEFKTQLESHPESAQLRYYLGLAYGHTDQYGKAYALHQQAAKLDTNSTMDSLYADLFAQYASRLSQDGKYDNAISWADTATNIDNQNDLAYYIKYMSQGLNLYHHASKWELWDAIVAFGKASQFQPDNPLPYYYSAKCYQMKNDKDFDNAIDAYQQALERNPSPKITEEINSNLKELKRRKKLYEDFWGN